jgi:adenine deaminase
MRRTVNLKLDPETFARLEAVANYNRLRGREPATKQALIEGYIAAGLDRDRETVQAAMAQARSGE